MKRIAFVILAFVLSCGIFYSISLLMKPKPISKMQPTSFKEVQQIGAVVYRRLRHDVQRAPLVILGTSPWIRDYDKIWSGLLLTAYEDKKYPKLLYQDQHLKAPIDIEGMEVKDLDLEAEILESLKPNEVFLIHAEFSESSRLFEQAYINRKKSKPGQNPVTITMLPLAVNEAELARIEPGCPLGEVAVTELEQIGCAIRRTSKKYFRKKLKPEGIWAVLEQHSPREYLLFVHEPNGPVSDNP